MIKRFKPTQKFRVVSENVSFYATAREIRNGVGDFTRFNSAVLACLDLLEWQRSCDPALACSTGLAGTWEGLAVQLTVA